MALRLGLFLIQGDFNMNDISVVFPKNTEKYVGLQCNNNKKEFSSLYGIEKIEEFLKKTPRVALDVGSGLGRVSVFFFKFLEWNETLFILADGDSGDKQFAGMRKGKADFYNSFTATESFCRANGMTNFKTFNLEKSTWNKLPNKPDLVYSFRALGMHWPINSFLEDVYPMLRKKCRLIFELRGTDEAALTWTKQQIAKINHSKYGIINIFLTPGKKIDNFIILERK